jgi:hypothetical protein
MDLPAARALALSLPEAHEAPHHDLTSFRVGTKIFATAPPDGDEVRIFVDHDETRACVAEDPAVFAELWWGKSLAGLAVHLPSADAERVAELLAEAWRRKAPGALVATYDAERGLA